MVSLYLQDYGNAFSSMAETYRTVFYNCGITSVLHQINVFMVFTHFRMNSECESPIVCLSVIRLVKIVCGC